MEIFIKSYCFNNVTFNSFTSLTEIELLEILGWRNFVETRKWMRNSKEISEKDHLKYCKGLSQNENTAHWVIQDKDKKLGVVSIYDFNPIENSCEWGFYLSNENRRPDTMLKVFYYSLHFLFEIIKLNNLTGFVKLENKGAILLNDFFGMVETDRIIDENELYSKRLQTKQFWENHPIDFNTMLKAFSRFVINKKRNETDRN